MAEKMKRKMSAEAPVEAAVKNTKGMTANKRIVMYAAGLLILLVLMIAGICIGAVPAAPSKLAGALLGDGSLTSVILFSVRVPRTLAALIAGSALAAAGVIIQSVLDNPLAGPNIIGVNAGAGLGTLAAYLIAPACLTAFPFAAIAGAFGTVLLVSGISRRMKASRSTLILAGIAVNAILSAAVDLITTMDPDTLQINNSFRIGGVAGVSMDMLSPAVFIIMFCLAAAFSLHNELDILMLGTETARSLGMNTGRMQLIFMLLAAGLAGSAISFTGILGFVGLIVPHFVRAFTGNESRDLLPLSAITGASFLILCDIVARTVFAPYEMPVGILLAFIGGPFFLYLIARRAQHAKA